MKQLKIETTANAIVTLDGLDINDVELAKNLYYFDDEYTVVKNWPNEKKN